MLELGGGRDVATNNAMELQAVLEVLKILPTGLVEVAIYADATYVLKGVQAWLPQWQKQGWKTQTGTTPANLVQWQELAQLLQRTKENGIQLRWHKVGGHTGDALNDRADAIAVSFSKGHPVDLFQGEAKDYPIRFNRVSSTKSPPSGRRYPLYLSFVSGVLQEHATWPECKARVDGASGAKTKKILSDEEYENIVRGWKA